MADGVAGSSAAARMRQHREEEEMTMYSPEDLNDWEFKIVRANWGAFGKPETFNKLIKEESQAGWELVEKFDNQRVRFKRLISKRASDAQLPAGIDPYRSHFGMSPLRFALLPVVGLLLGICLIYAVIFGLFGALGSFFMLRNP
jgi:hypothetical protein